MNIKRIIAGYLVVLWAAVLIAAAPSLEAQSLIKRYIVAVGANSGGKARVRLKYAASDAQSVAKIFEDLGGVAKEDVFLLLDPDGRTFYTEMGRLQERMARNRPSFGRTEMFFYYSGHSDEEHIMLGEEKITYKNLRDTIGRMPADVRIAILDSCASGALTLPKGVIRKSPFLMDAAYDMKGYAFMTSSSASEAAQESGLIKRSFFTHNLISGMRGAADRNQDGRITLNEAYQFAFDGTLAQTERTAGGPQHPNYHIQMSGTGDVVITEIWRSTSVLVLGREVAGKIFIHNRDNVLVLELTKPAGNEIQIGLEEGEYRITAVSGESVREAKIVLETGRSSELGRDDFKKVGKIPAEMRGIRVEPVPGTAEAAMEPEAGTAGRRRWRAELFGGWGAMTPGDLNMRVNLDKSETLFYYDDYLRYRVRQGEIASFSKTNQGGAVKLIKSGLPFGARVRYSLWSWLDVSLGLSGFHAQRTTTNKNTYQVVDLNGAATTLTHEYMSYRLEAEGLIPELGIHVGTRLNESVRLEGSVTGGPMFASCKYSINFRGQTPIKVLSGDFSDSGDGFLEEQGVGFGLALEATLRAEYQAWERFGIFLEGGYAHRTAVSFHGPGATIQGTLRENWEGDWAIKESVDLKPWGTFHSIWPSNAWVGFGDYFWMVRDFKLDLSGAQLRMGISYRF